jgi:hypothetical protein
MAGKIAVSGAIAARYFCGKWLETATMPNSTTPQT